MVLTAMAAVGCKFVSIHSLVNEAVDEIQEEIAEAKEELQGVLTSNTELSHFEKIDVSGAFEIELIQGPESAVEITADEALLPYITKKVIDNELRIGTTRKVKNVTTAHIKITAPMISEIELHGAAELVAEGPLNLHELEIESHGAADIQLCNLTVFELDIDSYGAASIEVKGLDAKKLKIELSGAGDATVEGTCEYPEFELSGVANLNITNLACPNGYRLKKNGFASVQK